MLFYLTALIGQLMNTITRLTNGVIRPINGLEALPGPPAIN